MKLTALASFVLASAATAAIAQENVIFEVHGKDKVLGTIRPTYEREGFLCDMQQGAVLKASVKSKSKTGPIPTLDVLFDNNSAGATVVTKGRGASIVPFTAPQAGIYKVVVGGDGVKDGDYQLKVSFTKTANRVTDLRDSALSGAFSGGPIVVGAVIDPDGGGTVSVSNTYSPLDGSSVDIPPGALGQPTSIFIAQANVYPVNDGINPAGPAVEFGPSGTQFPEGKEALVTIPFDVANFPGGTEALVVYVKDANGDIEAVPGPYTFGAGTVTFATSHFSTFQATTSQPRGLPQYGYDAFEIIGAPDVGLRGFVGVGDGYCYFSDGFGLYDYLQGVSFDPGVPGQVDPSVLRDSRPRTGLSGNPVVIDDRTIDVDDGLGGLVARIHRGFRDDVLVLDHAPGNELGVTVLVKRTDGEATLNTLAGRWHAFVWEFEGGNTDTAAHTVQLTQRIDAGRAVVAPDGNVTFTFPHRVERTTNFPGGVWTRKETVGGTATAQFAPASEIGLVLQFPDTESWTYIYPTLDGNLIFCPLYNMDRGFGSATARTALLVLARESGHASIRKLAGGYFDVGGGVDLESDPVAGKDGLGLEWHAESGSATVSSARTFTQNSVFCRSYYDDTGRPLNDTIPLSVPSATLKLLEDGSFSIPAAHAWGAFAAPGDFFLHVQADDRSMLMGFGTRFQHELILVKEPGQLVDGR